jgi:hypothetical protein
LSRPADPPSEDDYSLQIESHFAQRRGTPFIFSAKDWALLQQWKESGIPLPVVLEAIDRCFESREKAGRKRTVSSLRYCRHAVTELWEERRELLVGAGAELPEVQPLARLGELAAAVEDSAAQAGSGAVGQLLRATAEQLRGIAETSVPRIEEELLSIEQRLMDALVGALSAEERAVMESDIERQLSGYSSTDPVLLEKTRQANLRRLLRTRLTLPRLSLFG